MEKAGIIYLHNASKLTKKQFERLSSIFDNIGQVVLASGLGQSALTGVDPFSIFVLLSAVGLSLLFWIISLWFARKTD